MGFPFDSIPFDSIRFHSIPFHSIRFHSIPLCRHPLPLPLPLLDTGLTIYTPGIDTKATPHPTFIPSRIITPNAKNKPNYTTNTSSSFAIMSRALPGGIGLPDGPQRIAPIRMDTLMSAAQVRNIHWTARTRFSRKSNGGATESNSLKNEWDSLREFYYKYD